GLANMGLRGLNSSELVEGGFALPAVRVRGISGPLREQIGMLAALRPHERVLVLLQLLGGQQRVALAPRSAAAIEERPLSCAASGHVAAEQRDELAPSHHSITSSASANILSGIVSSSALAVLRLITNSNLVGCSTARSAGLVPFNILSTYS